MAEPEAPQEAAPGFDQALANAEIEGNGAPPPVGPPGPEPPPPPGKAPVAGEEVTKPEPNALSKKPDFLPLPEIDVDMPAPFWEAPAAVEGTETQAETPTDTQAVDQAMSLLASQMIGGLFAAPQAAVPAPTPDQAVVVVDGLKTSDVDVRGPQVDWSQAGIFPVENPGVPSGFSMPIDGTPTDDTPVEFPELEPNCPPFQAPETSEVPPHCEITPPTGFIPEEADGFLNVQDVVVDTPVAQAPAIPGVQAPVAKTNDIETPVTPEEEIAVETTKQTSRLQTSETVSRPVPTDVEDKSLLQKAPVKTTGEDTAQESDPTAVKPSIAGEVKRADAPRTEKTETAPKTQSTATATDSAKTTLDNSQSQTADSNPGKQETKSEAKAVSKEAPVTQEAVVTTDATPTVTTANVPATNAASTTTKIADAAPLPPKEVDLVVKQVADRMQMLAAARPKNGVTIHLNPDNLGTVTVIVKAIGQQVSTEMFASDDRVRNALDQNQTRLTEAMSSRGFQLQSVTVSDQTNHSTHSHGQRDWQNQTSQNGQTSDHSGRQEGRQPGHGQAQSQLALQESGASNRWMRFNEGVDIAI